MLFNISQFKNNFIIHIVVSTVHKTDYFWGGGSLIVLKPELDIA